MDGIDDLTSVLERASGTGSVLSTSPAGVNEPAVDLVLRHTVGQHLGVPSRLLEIIQSLGFGVRSTGVRITYMKNNERSAVASREGRNGFEDTVLSPRSFPTRTVSRCYGRTDRVVCLRGVTGQEVVASLLGGQFTDRWENTESIAGEHDDVLGLTLNYTRNASVGDELDRVSATGILGDADIVVVGLTSRDVVDDVLEDGTKTDGTIDLGLLLGGKVNALGVASALDIENTVV